jgi:hypothetical protein
MAALSSALRTKRVLRSGRPVRGDSWKSRLGALNANQVRIASFS